MVDWEFLSIEPTTDLKAIKRAYAKKLKMHHPEDDPEGYQKLRETFEQAKRYARENKAGNKAQVVSENSHYTGFVDDEPLHTAKKNDTDTGSSEKTDPQVDDHDDYMVFSPLRDESESPDNSLEKIQAFMEQVEELYYNYSARIGWYNWEKLLEADIVWDIGQNDVLTFRLLDFLKDHHQFPQRIWQVLNNQLNIREKYPEFFNTYIRDYPNLHYQPLVKADHINRDDFLYYRNQFYQHLARNDLDEAERAMQNAEEIYTDDPDFLRLQAEYYRRIGNISDSLKALHAYTELHPEDMDMLLKKAHVLLEANHPQEALQSCQAAAQVDPDNVQILRLEGQCLYRMGAFAQARKKFQRVLAEKKLDIISQTYLAKVNAELGKENLKHETKQNIRQEMGIMGLREKARLYWGILPKIRVTLAFIFIFVVLTALNEEYKESTGVGVFDFYKQKMASPEIVQVESSSDFPNPDNENILVSATLHDAFFTGYYHTQVNDGQNHTNDNYFIKAQLGNMELLYEEDAELVWGGYLNDGTPILSLLPYSEDRSLTYAQDIEVLGNWQSVPPDRPGNKLENEFSFSSTAGTMEAFNQDILLNSTNIVNTDIDTFNLILNTIVLMFIFLALLYYLWFRAIYLLLLLRY